MLTISILDMSLKIINRRSKPRLPRANELIRLLKIFTYHVDVMNWTHLSFIIIIIIIMQPILIDNSDIARIPYSKHTCVLYLTLEIFFAVLQSLSYSICKALLRHKKNNKDASFDYTYMYASVHKRFAILCILCMPNTWSIHSSMKCRYASLNLFQSCNWNSFLAAMKWSSIYTHTHPWVIIFI